MTAAGLGNRCAGQVINRLRINMIQTAINTYPGAFSRSKNFLSNTSMPPNPGTLSVLFHNKVSLLLKIRRFSYPLYGARIHPRNEPLFLYRVLEDERSELWLLLRLKPVYQYT